MYHTIYFILFLINLSIWLFDCPELWTMWTLFVWRSITFVFPLDRQSRGDGQEVSWLRSPTSHRCLVSGVDCCCSRGDLVPPSAGDHRHHRVTATSVINPDHQLPPPWLLDDALDSRGQSIRVNKIKFFFLQTKNNKGIPVIQNWVSVYPGVMYASILFCLFSKYKTPISCCQPSCRCIFGRNWEVKWSREEVRAAACPKSPY